ncbi:C13 family peptidase [Microbulbifer bruguierae]|uniref:C13 family peptidase n=1 Tax=Microbulbifer bruguierae TaxID=3029061 RepID=A0ABY8N8D2_9GAMM|nr:C13 family peptidase [Microbulbifer bruguierae]WGL15166.1 C13 family peptidase [Microbulbifer bruguierae]
MQPAHRITLLLLFTLSSPAYSLDTPAVSASSAVTLPDGSRYQGALKNGLLHGQGTLTWPDGRRYQGGFQQGVMSGDGRLEYSEDCVYLGGFQAGDFHGPGRYDCEGIVWEGEFQHGVLPKGSIAWENGDRYSGALQDFMPHGQGHRTTAHDSHYEGTFQQGLLIEGSYRDSLGHHYQGTFEGEMYHGEGELTYPDGVTLRATFEYGEANGPAVLIYNSDSGERREESAYFDAGRYYPSRWAWQDNTRTQAKRLEKRLYSEDRRLESALSKLAPQRPGVRDVYLLIVGGDGSEAVFPREVDWVATQLGHVFDLNDRQLRLSNGSGRWPLATGTSIRKSLNALDKLIDPQEDLLLVHLVSHGDSDGTLVLGVQGLDFNDLSVKDGMYWFDGLRASHQWIIVSACYSGHWQDALASPERVVFTSSAADRTSFGCDSDSQRTWFSSALYGELQQQDLEDPQAWFQRAKMRVTEMETGMGIEEESQSLPQFSVGKKFLRWWKG